MRRDEPKSIGDVLRLTIQECNMTTRLNEQKAIEMWRPIVGAYVADNCGRPMVKLGIMTVPVPSPALRHELTMNRSSIITLINRKLGQPVIKDIRFSS